MIKVGRHVQSTEKRSLLNFSNILTKSIATAFVFYCDVKHSDTLLGSSHVCRYLFLCGCGQKWAWYFRRWNSEICCISTEWIDKMNWCWYKFRKANVNLVIIRWTWSKMFSYKVYVIWDSKIRCISHIIWLSKQIDSIIIGLTTNLLCIFCSSNHRKISFRTWFFQIFFNKSFLIKAWKFCFLSNVTLENIGNIGTLEMTRNF